MKPIFTLLVILGLLAETMAQNNARRNTRSTATRSAKTPPSPTKTTAPVNNVRIVAAPKDMILTISSPQKPNTAVQTPIQNTATPTSTPVASTPTPATPLPSPSAKPKETKQIPNVAQYLIGLDGDFRQGNIDRRLLKARFSLNYETPKSIIGFSTNPRFAYGTFKGQLNEKELFVDWNTTFFAYQRRLYYLVFGIYEKSNLRKISNRMLGGAGFGYRIIGDKNHPNTRIKLSVTNAFLFENTDFYTKSDVSVIRNSTRIKLSAEIIKGKLFFNNTTFLQPSLNKSNFRWNALSGLTVRASKKLGLNVLLDNSYESVVPEGIKNTDIVLTFGLSFTDDFSMSRRRSSNRPYDWWMK